MSNQNKHKDIQTIGNPALIATALAPTIQQNAPAMIKSYTSFVRAFLIILGVAGGGFLVYRWAAAQRKKSLEAKAGQDPDIKAAIDIYTAIPSGLKKGEGSLLNPFGLISDLYNKLATLWQSTDTKRILEISKRIKDNKRVFKVFRALYGEDLYQLLSKAMSPSELDLFIAHSGPSHSASVTPAIPKANALFTTKAVRIRKTPVNQDGVSSESTIDWLKNKTSELVRKTTGYGSNVIGTAEPDMFIGLSTGREIADDIGKTVFLEFKGIKKGKTNWDVPAYVWKGAVKSYNKDQLLKEFGNLDNVLKKAFYLDPSNLDGLEGFDIQIKSTSPATVFDENMRPLSSVGRNFMLGKVIGTLDTGKELYVRFRTVTGTERYIDSKCISEL